MTTAKNITTAPRSLDILFSESSRSIPTRPALFTVGKHWSYAALDLECRKIELALQLAGLAGKECNIGLIYGRSAFSYAAVIAIMRSGNVYVPLNGKMPAERLLKIFADATIDTVLIDTAEPLPDSVVMALRESASLRLIVADSTACTALESFEHEHQIVCASRKPTDHELQPAVPAELAYIIYTSGSTGIPKGVAISHRSAYGCIDKLMSMFATVETDRFTQFSALSFDVSIADMFLCWKSGATLYVPAQSESLVPLKFATTHDITVWSSVPSLASFLLKLNLLQKNALPSVRYAFFAGETLPIELCRAWSIAAAHCRIFNLYGPTECTVFATWHEFKAQKGVEHGIVPIGEPLEDLRAKIIRDGEVVHAEGESGELWLTGDQLAQGYWKNDSATRAAFVKKRLDADTERVWYRTGDLVSYQEAVGYTYRGRLDRQVKLRGFRVELQEVESALRDVIGCAIVAVVAVRGAAGICEMLVAYCDELFADEPTIKSRCLSRIPSYMIPEHIVKLEAFPLGSSGKIDYLALAARAAGYKGPRDGREAFC